MTNIIEYRGYRIAIPDEDSETCTILDHLAGGVFSSIARAQRWIDDREDGIAYLNEHDDADGDDLRADMEREIEPDDAPFGGDQEWAEDMRDAL